MQGSYGTFTVQGLLGVKTTDVFYHDGVGERIEGATLRETLFYRSVRHPNVMRATMIRQTGRRLCTWMPAARENLHDAEPGHGRHVLTGILQALAHMHACGIAHGDLKPENIVVMRDGRVQLIDFGAAQWRSERGYARTYTSYCVVPPEDALRGQFGPAADIWAVGIIMVFYWTRRHMVDVSSREAAAAWFIANPVTPVPPDVPAWAHTLVARMLDRDPVARITAVDALRVLGEERVTGTFRDVPRTHAELAAHIAGPAPTALSRECAARMARALLEPTTRVYTADISRAVWGRTGSRHVRRVRTAVRRLLQRLRP